MVFNSKSLALGIAFLLTSSPMCSAVRSSSLEKKKETRELRTKGKGSDIGCIPIFPTPAPTKGKGKGSTFPERALSTGNGKGSTRAPSASGKGKGSSAAPSFFCSSAPSLAPSVSPSQGPTVTASSSPSLSPSSAPSMALDATIQYNGGPYVSGGNSYFFSATLYVRDDLVAGMFTRDSTNGATNDGGYVFDSATSASCVSGDYISVYGPTTRIQDNATVFILVTFANDGTGDLRFVPGATQADIDQQCGATPLSSTIPGGTLVVS